MKNIFTILSILIFSASFGQTTTSADTIYAKSRLRVGNARSNGISNDSANNKRSDFLITEKASKQYTDSAVKNSVDTAKIATLFALKDTATAIRSSFPNNGVDSIWNTHDTLYWRKSGITHYNIIDTFDTNPTVFGTTIGKYGAGSTPNWKGMSARQAIIDAITQCIHPTYYTPTASITASPSFGAYEYGYNLGTVTLSSSYTQNDGGSNTATTYYMNGSALGGNTTTISNLTSTQSFYVNKSYGQGAVKNDNCGNADATGQIGAGSVNSGTSSYTTYFKRYYGFVNSTSPSNSDILALSQDNNGSTAALTLSNATPSGSQYLVYFTKGTVSSVTVNGIPATGAFTITTYSVTNAQGATTTYSYVYSNNAQTSTLSSVIFN